MGDANAPTTATAPLSKPLTAENALATTPMPDPSADVATPRPGERRPSATAPAATAATTLTTCWFAATQAWTAVSPAMNCWPTCVRTGASAPPIVMTICRTTLATVSIASENAAAAWAFLVLIVRPRPSASAFSLLMPSAPIVRSGISSAPPRPNTSSAAAARWPGSSMREIASATARNCSSGESCCSCFQSSPRSVNAFWADFDPPAASASVFCCLRTAFSKPSRLDPARSKPNCSCDSDSTETPVRWLISSSESPTSANVLAATAKRRDDRRADAGQPEPDVADVVPKVLQPLFVRLERAHEGRIFGEQFDEGAAGTDGGSGRRHGSGTLGHERFEDVDADDDVFLGFRQRVKVGGHEWL